MEFPRSRIISAKRLSQLMKEYSKSRERFCFILGSGASVESGIPSGSSLEMQWMDCLMGKMEDRDMPAMDADETRELAAALYEEKAIQHEFREIEEAWLCAKKGNRSISSKYYFDIYKLRFHANPHQGYSYLERIMERCDPSLGYHTLAKLLTESNQHNLVITTNFDSLVEDALFIYTNKKPLVVSHESLADYMEANIQRPIVAKVHRGLMYMPFNSPETTQELKPEWQKALNYAFNTYTPIVIGYAGGDRSLMSFLKKDTTAMRNGIYWCYRGKCDPSELPEADIQEFVWNRNGYFVAIDGFDALMVEIGKAMYGDDIRPGRTMETLKEAYEGRVRKYHEQWSKLNEREEMKKTLQDMNAAEQQEENQREKEKSLTAQDHLRRGVRAFEEGRKEDAMKEYTEAIKKDHNYAVAYGLRGKLYADFGDFEKALKDYNKSIELDPDNPLYYSMRGEIYEELKDYEKALEDYNKSIELNPENPFYYSKRGGIYERLKDYEKALENYNKSIELNPDNPLYYSMRGILYKELKDYEKALEDYNKSIELDPENPFYYSKRGGIYERLKDYEKALEDYNKSIELDPENPFYYSVRGVLYEELKDYEKALEGYNKSIELDPDNPVYYSIRGKLYKKLEDYEKAFEDYSKAIQVDPDNPSYYNDRGKLYEELKDYEKALKDYNSAIALNPHYAYAYINRGVAYETLKKYKKAFEDYCKAIELNPDEPYVYCRRGVVYQVLGEHEKAIEDYTRAIQLDFTYKAAYTFRAFAYGVLGQEALAEADRKAAAEL